MVGADYSRFCVSVCMRLCEFFHYEAVLLINTFAFVDVIDEIFFLFMRFTGRC